MTKSLKQDNLTPLPYVLEIAQFYDAYNQCLINTSLYGAKFKKKKKQLMNSKWVILWFYSKQLHMWSLDWKDPHRQVSSSFRVLTVLDIWNLHNNTTTLQTIIKMGLYLFLGAMASQKYFTLTSHQHWCLL